MDGLAKELGGYGADTVLVYDSPLLKNYTTDGYTKVLTEAVMEYKPEVLLIGASNIGRDLGAQMRGKASYGSLQPTVPIWT